MPPCLTSCQPPERNRPPVTLDLAAHVVVRARAEDERRFTDLVLPHSRREGKTARIATDRRFLRRALKLGFRTFQFTDPEKPVLCQERNRVYVWMPLTPALALAPQTNALRVMLPASTDDRSALSAPEPAESFAPVRPAPGGRFLRPLDGLVHCTRMLWDLVRKHHKETVR